MVRAKELEAAGRIPSGSARAACEGAIRQAPPAFYADLDADMIDQILGRWAVALR